MRIRGVDPIIAPARKSCISPSDSAATAPVMPLDTMLARRSPGAMTANIACITLVMVLIGPQLVSPSTRNATRPSGTERRIASIECHTGVAKKSDWTAISATVQTPAPRPTQRSERSPVVTSAAVSERSVAISTRQRRSSAHIPPATSRPTDGHITSSRMSTRRPSAASSPCDTSHGGITTQARRPPISMLALMRRPMMMPEPMLRSDTPKPSPTRPEKSLTTSGTASLTHCRTVARNTRPDATSAAIIANADLRACGPRASRAISVSPAAMPSGNGRFSSSMKCLRSGTARNTPSRPEAVSQAQVWNAVRFTSKVLPGSSRIRSKAASSQQRNATCPADVPAVCTTLFSQRL